MDEFVEGIKDTHIDEMTEDELRLIFDKVSENSKMGIQEFIYVVSPPMSDERKEMVKKGFQILDVSKDGRIDMSEMKDHVEKEAMNHPHYKTGMKRLLEETIEKIGGLGFIGHLDKDGDNEVTLEEAVQYFDMVGAGIKRDAVFEDMVKTFF